VERQPGAGRKRRQAWAKSACTGADSARRTRRRRTETSHPGGQLAQPQADRAVWDRHDLKGEREQMFSQLLCDLDLHHPPCLALAAHQAFYTLAALAYNVLTALKLAELPVEQHGWRVRTLIRHLLTLPAKLSRHAGARVLRLYCPAGWLDWWRLWRERAAPG
jgi:hypothetical protein